MNLYVFYLFILGLSFYFCVNAVVLIRIFLTVLLEVSTVSVSTQARISPRWSFSSITFLEIVVASSACFPPPWLGFHLRALPFVPLMCFEEDHYVGAADYVLCTDLVPCSFSELTA